MSGAEESPTSVFFIHRRRRSRSTRRRLCRSWSGGLLRLRRRLWLWFWLLLWLFGFSGRRCRGRLRWLRRRRRRRRRWCWWRWWCLSRSIAARGGASSTGEEAINVDNVLQEAPLGVNLLTILDLVEDSLTLLIGQLHERVEPNISLSFEGDRGRGSDGINKFEKSHVFIYKFWLFR